MSEQLERLWDHFNDRLAAFIRSRVDDPEDAEDILQEVFLRIHCRLDTVRDLDRLESWVYQIARNCIIDAYRKRSPTIELPETLEIATEDEPAEDDAHASLAPYIHELVEALPEPYRQALILTEFEGLSQKEMAQRLGISVSGAKSRVQRARYQIREVILACCHLEFDRRGMIYDYWEHCCCCAGEPAPI